jgi:prepilin peptidase CpaA
MSPWENAFLLSLAVVLIAAVVSDLRSRRIPNALLLFGLALGVFFQSVSPHGIQLFFRPWGSIGVLNSLYGLLVGIAIFLPFYILRTLGAGDVKLLAMLGVWFGPYSMVGVALLTSLSGGILALVVAIWNRSLRQVLKNINFMMTDSLMQIMVSGRTIIPTPVKTTGRLPYAVAIASGAALEVVLLKGWYR